MNPADVQEAIINLEDALSSSSSGSSAQNPHSKISAWVPFKVVSKEVQDEDEAILKSLQVIVEHRLTLANRIYLDERAETTKAFLTHHEGRRPVGLPVEGSMEQLRLLPMEPTNLNKELVRIRKLILTIYSHDTTDISRFQTSNSYAVSSALWMGTQTQATLS